MKCKISSDPTIKAILNQTGKPEWNGQISRQIPGIKVNQGQVNNLKSPISPKEIEALINSLPNKKTNKTKKGKKRIY